MLIANSPLAPLPCPAAQATWPSALPPLAAHQGCAALGQRRPDGDVLPAGRAWRSSANAWWANWPARAAQCCRPSARSAACWCRRWSTHWCNRGAFRAARRLADSHRHRHRLRLGVLALVGRARAAVAAHFPAGARGHRRPGRHRADRRAVHREDCPGWRLLLAALLPGGAAGCSIAVGVTRLAPYLLTGLLLWLSVLKSGVHATLAGVALGLAIPLARAGQPGRRPRLEHALHPWVAFVILPVFALANAGVPLAELELRVFAHPVTAGYRARVAARQARGRVRLHLAGACASASANLPGGDPLAAPVWRGAAHRHRLHHEPVPRRAGISGRQPARPGAPRCTAGVDLRGAGRRMLAAQAGRAARDVKLSGTGSGQGPIPLPPRRPKSADVSRRRRRAADPPCRRWRPTTFREGIGLRRKAAAISRAGLFERGSRCPVISTTGNSSSVTIGCTASSRPRHAAQIECPPAGRRRCRSAATRQEVFGAGERFAAKAGGAQSAVRGLCGRRHRRRRWRWFSWRAASAGFSDWCALYGATRRRIAAIRQPLVFALPRARRRE